MQWRHSATWPKFTACPLQKTDSQEDWLTSRWSFTTRARTGAERAYQNTAELGSVCSENEGRRRTSHITRRRTNLSGIPGSGVLEIIYPLVACIYGR
jgi:hypothetical protein